MFVKTEYRESQVMENRLSVGRNDSLKSSSDSALSLSNTLPKINTENKKSASKKPLQSDLSATEKHIENEKPSIPQDITPPVVGADPGPGIHDSPIDVRLFADESAVIRYRKDTDTLWIEYKTPIHVIDSITLTIIGIDSSQNVSEKITRFYKVVRQTALKCPPDMVVIETGKLSFCIDRYEWPNKKGVVPIGFINWYMAYDSCRTYKKRLCTSSEWEIACGGRSAMDYPYGEKYETKTCNTETTGPASSGSLEECRSYFGAYDLSGNLREWTGTRASRNDRHYQVYGGYWDNRGASKCNSTQYSFFPENKFITIGFRCCMETR